MKVLENIFLVILFLVMMAVFWFGIDWICDTTGFTELHQKMMAHISTKEICAAILVCLVIYLPKVAGKN